MFALFIGSAYFILDEMVVLPSKRQKVIQTTLDWGGLADLPINLEEVHIEKRGSIFTRQFILEFEFNSQSEVDKWIIQSKRLRTLNPIIKGNSKVYEIYPGELDSYGGIIEISGKKVRIDMSWS
jgi:hypothetical protein